MRYATDGTVSIRRSGTTYTGSVGTPFAIDGASCSLAATTVIGTWTGTGATLSGSHSTFSATACTYSSWGSSSISVNSDRSLTVTTPTGPRLFERI